MRSVFKLKVILLLVLIYISANIGLKAAHIIGAEINYKQIDGNTYRFTLKMYRDCNECKFDNNGGGSNTNKCPEVPNLKIKGALNSLYSGLDLGEVVLTRTKIEDKTPTCYSAVSKCRNGSTINYGYEFQEFQGTFNFTSLVLSGKCEFDVSLAMSSRNAGINSTLTEQNFFNFTYLNLCNSGAVNQSTKFELSPVFVLLQNQTHHISLGVTNEDNDSLSFKLRPALLNRNSSVSYAFGRSYTQPYGVYCTSGVTCPPSPNAPIAEGFYVSSTTGDVVFTPVMLNEGGVIVVECEEWKTDNDGKRYLAGLTRRDIYAEVITPTNNLPKVKNNELSIDLCEGEPFNYQINLEDIKLYSLSPDSVTVNVISDLSDMVLSKTTLNIPPYNFYHLDLKNTLNRKGIYYITINAMDNNCPLRGMNSKTVVLNILEKRKLEYNYKVKNCGLFQVENKLKNQDVRWTLCDINDQPLKKQFGVSMVYQLSNGGQYILKGSLDAIGNLCAVNLVDTLSISDFRNPEFELGQDVTACKNTQIVITPKNLKTFDTYKVILNNTEIAFPYSSAVISSKKYTIRIVQSDGCYAEDNININVHPELIRKYKTDTICSNFEGLYSLDKLLIADRNKISSLDIESISSSVNVEKQGNFDYKLKIVIPENRELKFTDVITDMNSCSYLDTFYLQMIDPKPINVKLTDKICSNAGGLLLPVGTNGTWKSANYPNNISGNKLFIQPPYSGLINLEYTETNKCTNSKKFDLMIIDTLPISLLNGKNLVLCQNAAPLVLAASPANGKWEGSFINQDIFYPFSAGNTKNNLKYTFVNTNGCISTQKMTIEVVELPELTIESNKSTVCLGEELMLKANVNMNTFVGYWFTDGDGRFEHQNMLSTGYIPTLKDVRNGPINFKFTIQTNGVCGNISESIDIFVKETPVGKIKSDYDLAKCEPASFKFETDFTNVTKQYWYVNDTLREDFDYAFGFSTVLMAGNYNIKTKVFNGECSAEAVSLPVEVYSTPASNFIANPNYRLSREYPRLYLKDITKSKNPFSSKWYFNNVLINEDKEFYYNIETSDDTFNIKLVNLSSIGSCENSVSRQFVFSPINQLYIPDAFTPDAKGPDENNEFKVKGPLMAFFYIEIYNKWGELVYFSKDMNAAWDGNFGGKPALQGVYFYKINSTDTNGSNRDYSGTVTLIR